MKHKAGASKPRRYADGGEVTEYTDGRAPTARDTADEAPAPRKLSFREAFAAAKDGSTFEWENPRTGRVEKFKKEYAKPAAASAPAAKSSPPRKQAPARASSAPAASPAPAADPGPRVGRASQASAAGSETPDRDAVARAVQARMERDRRRMDEPFAGLETLKKIGARIGTAETRERLKAQGYADGGLVKRGKLKSHGKAC